MIKKKIVLGMMLACIGAVLPAGAPSAGAAINNADYTTQIQAADVLSRFLTDLNARAEARFEAMSSFLRETGASRAYTRQRKAPQRPASAEFDRVYLGAIQFIKDGGESYADPALPRLDTPRLLAQLRLLQAYNIQQFLALDMRQKELHAISAFLQSNHQLPAYQQWAAKRKVDQQPPAQSELPPADSAAAFAKEMKSRLEAARAEGWREAQANGLTAEQFDQQWSRRQLQQQRLIGYRLSAIASAAAPPSPSSAPPPPSDSASPLPPLAPSAVPAPSDSSVTVYDPRWSPYYYGPTDAWNGWDDTFMDAFSFRSGSGIYRRYDQRLNRAFDLRLNGTYDRRVDIDNDRRLNIHEDPRESF
jgi:hypothetical protein